MEDVGGVIAAVEQFRSSNDVDTRLPPVETSLTAGFAFVAFDLAGLA